MRPPSSLPFCLALSFCLSLASSASPSPPSRPLITRARLEVARGVAYDPSYAALSYPNGDLDPDRGVCTDVVIRAFRAEGVDFQQLVHEDILARPAAFLTVKHTDTNIDHRRVTPLLTYLREPSHATSLPRTFGETALPTWQPGDIVVWAFRPCPSCSPDHVGIVSDRMGPRGLPLVLHNIGPKPSEDDRIDAFTVLGHFRMPAKR